MRSSSRCRPWFFSVSATSCWPCTKMTCIGCRGSGWAGGASPWCETSSAQVHHRQCQPFACGEALARSPRELEEVSMTIVGGLDIHRKQLTFDYVDTVTGEVQRGQVAPADRSHLADWLARRFTGRSDVEFALEGCTGWRYVAEELARAVLRCRPARRHRSTARA